MKISMVIVGAFLSTSAFAGHYGENTSIDRDGARVVNPDGAVVLVTQRNMKPRKGDAGGTSGDRLAGDATGTSGKRLAGDATGTSGNKLAGDAGGTSGRPFADGAFVKVVTQDGVYLIENAVLKNGLEVEKKCDAESVETMDDCLDLLDETASSVESTF